MLIFRISIRKQRNDSTYSFSYKFELRSKKEQNTQESSGDVVRVGALLPGRSLCILMDPLPSSLSCRTARLTSHPFFLG